MPIDMQETPDSRMESMLPSSFTLRYRITGEQDQDAVAYYAIASTPTAALRPTGILYRQNIEIEPDGWANYLVTVPYGPLARDPGSISFSFDTTGATINIKAAKEHVATYDSGGVAAGDWHKGAIGVKGDGEVEGAEIVVPALKLSYGFRHPQGQVNESFARSLASVTGTTNSTTFRGFAAGELLFIGATGSDGTDAEAELQYQFIASQNESGISIGEVTSIVKQGHHYAWVEFKDEVTAGEAVRQPKRVHIERVYNSTNFAAVFGWG